MAIRLKTVTPNGFTLIELSVVLVIVGLIVGGILAGRELIEASRLRAQIKQIDAYSAAVNTFRHKYSLLPGDLSSAQCTQFGFATGHLPCAGANSSNIRGNGQLEGAANNDDTGTGSPVVYLWGEVRSVFPQLSKARLIPTNQIETADLMYGHGQAFPFMALNDAYGLWATSMEGRVWLYLGMTEQQSGLGTPPTRNASTQGVMTPLQAENIDLKVDDGKPVSGSVRAYYVPNGGLQFLPHLIVNRCSLDAGGLAYNVTDTVTRCRLAIRLH